MYTVWIVLAILLILVFLERNMIHASEPYEQPGMLYKYWGAVYDNARFPEYRW